MEYAGVLRLFFLDVESYAVYVELMEHLRL